MADEVDVTAAGEADRVNGDDGDVGDAEATFDLAEVLAVAAGATVAWTAAVALVSANADRFDGRATLAAGVLVPVAAALLWYRHRRRVRITAGGLAVLAVAGVLGSVVLLPGFPYLAGDKDPGVYAAHGLAIERTGSTAVPDPVLAAADQVPVTPYLVDRVPALYPGYWVDQDDPTRVRPQFFHLLPALLATAASVGGERALFNLMPLLAGVAAATIGLAVRRVAGTLAGCLTVTLLLVNLMQVWHSRHPATEVLVQLFVATAGLALILAVRTHMPWLSALAGALVAAAFLARPDGLLLVVLGIVVACLLLGLGRGAPHPARFLTGLALALPYPLYQAYDLNRTYMLANHMPDWPLVLAGVVLTGAGAVALRLLVVPRWDALDHRGRELLRGHDPRTVLAAAAGALAAAGLVLAWFRPNLFDLVMATTLDGDRIPRLDEYNLRKLSWFVTIPGLVAMWAGLVLALRRRPLAHLWLLILPGALLFPVFVWQAKIESRLMWWSRRFVPVIIPAMVVLIALALAAALRHRGSRQWVVRGAGLLVSVVVIVSPLRQTLDVRSHREFGGSVELVAQIADVGGGEPSMFLWQFPRDRAPFDGARIFGGPVGFVHGHVSALLPRAATAADVDAFLAAFPDRRAFVVTRGDDPFPPLADHTVTRRLRIDTGLTHWNEADFEVPKGWFGVIVDLTVWEVERT